MEKKRLEIKEVLVLKYREEDGIGGVGTIQIHATLVGGKCVAQLYLYSHAGLIISIVRERPIRRT